MCACVYVCVCVINIIKHYLILSAMCTLFRNVLNFTVGILIHLKERKERI